MSSWTCPKCTFDNNELMPQCEMCGHSTASTTSSPIVQSNSSKGSKKSLKSKKNSPPPALVTRQKSMLTSDMRHNDETIAREERKLIISSCTAAKSKFVDDSFPPSPKSLFFNGYGPLSMADEINSIDSGRLVYSDCNRRQLWVPLIEKACAKLYGCYESLVAGKSVEALALFTGAPCEVLTLQSYKDDDVPDLDMIWTQILSSIQSGHVMGASCGGGRMQADERAFKAMGLRAKHAYSILDIRLINQVKLIQVRNPWGRYSWNGAYSDKSPQMTPQLKNTLKAWMNDQGVFWMCFEDFAQYFDSIDICRLNTDWENTKIDGVIPNRSSTQQHMGILTVFNPTEVFITFYQKGFRSSNSKAMDLAIIVCKCSETSNFAPVSYFCSSKRKLSSAISCSAMFEPGMYLVLPFAVNHYDVDQLPGHAPPPHFTLSFHSGHPVMVDRFFLGTYTVADSLWLLLQKRGERHQGRNCVTIYYLAKGWSGLMIAVENRHPAMYLQVSCDCSDSFNVVSTRGVFKTMDCVPPLHRQMLIILTTLEASAGHNISHKLTHRMSSYPGLDNWALDPRICNQPPITPAVWGIHASRPL